MLQKAKAELLRKLHGGPEVLVLPNAWDAISARIVEDAGFPAVATTSAGLAAVLGYPDGQRIPQPEMLFLVRKMAKAVEIPVTADVEAGYADAVQTALDLIACGAVGMNLEDMVGGQLIPLEAQVETIRAIRTVATAEGVPMVINARTDIFLAEHGDAGTRFDRAVERLNAFRAAGADCLFAPGVTDAGTIGRLAKAVTGPLNILASAGSPSIAEMKALGVRRVSLGSGPSRVAAGALRRFLYTLRDAGTFSALSTEAIPYQEIQQLLSR
ncbi:MAG TPA: isocitrate lyase/phosphoenolpyruvate mutase family protein [Bryobacteraceae bacterium]|nr:isocitrate lyase/phosphoenolpyruvate mutase family protein [Bryobacteraceae bacterium]